MPKYPSPAPAETVRGAMHGFLLRRPRDPLALKLAVHCQSPSPSTSPSRPGVPGNNALPAARGLVVAVRVAQGRRLAVRPLLEPMYARHGLRTRCFLVRDGYGRVGRVVESERNAGGSMRHPVWTRTLFEVDEMLRLPVEGSVAGVSLTVEVVCGILVVASAVVELEKVGGRAEPRWTPLAGDAGLLELALGVEEVEEEEVEEEMPMGTSAWVHKLTEQAEDDDDDDELTLEYSSSSDELDGGVVEEQQGLETRGEEVPAVEEDAEWRRRETERRRRMQLLPDAVTVARAGATTMYFPRQAGGRGGNEQERLLDKQLWDLYAFGIAAHAPGRAGDDPDPDGEDEWGEASPRASEVSQSASTCASDVLGFNQFIQNLEAATTRERLAKSRKQQHEQQGDNQEAGQAVEGGCSHPEQTETNATAQPTPVPVRRRALEQSPWPREGVVLFDPASLSSPLAPETTSRRQQRRGSVMPGAEAARVQPQAGTRRRRSLPINAVYAQLQRKLLAGVHAIRRQPQHQPQPQPQPQPPTPAAPQAELTRKRSMSLHAVTDLFRPERLDLTDASRHRSNSSGDSRSAFSSSSSSHSTSPFAAAPPSTRRSSAGASAVVFLQGEPLCVGCRILVGRASPGVVLFIGPVRFAAGAWLGVALDEPKGKTDGVVDGVRYFTCAPGHGILLRASRLDLRLLPSPGDDE